MTQTPMQNLTCRLSEVFDPRHIKWKPHVVKDGKALAIPYVDVKTVMKRLNDVLGVEGWQDEYEFLPNGSCLCRLSIRVGDSWIVKTDVGSPQPGGDPAKTAVSGALKRAALRLGIGRYLYGVEKSWLPYDHIKKCFIQQPTLPTWALPKPAKKEVA
jgi:hypothetical protein